MGAGRPKNENLPQSARYWSGDGVAVETTLMAMLIADPTRPDVPIVFANDSFLKMSGCDREEVLGRNYHFLSDTDPAVAREIDLSPGSATSSTNRWTFVSRPVRSSHAVMAFSKGRLSSTRRRSRPQVRNAGQNGPGRSSHGTAPADLRHRLGRASGRAEPEPRSTQSCFQALAVMAWSF